jgi:hypothetical protein
MVERLFVGGPVHGQSKQGPEERQTLTIIEPRPLTILERDPSPWVDRERHGTYELTTFVLPSGDRVPVMAWKGWTA